MSNALTVTPLSDLEYRQITHAILSEIEAAVDRWLEGETIDIDTRRSGGLLELVFPNRSHIVINTQPPLQELWMAAKSGGFHYRHVEGRWLDREGNEFFGALSACASAQAGKVLKFEPVS
ncbi:iron donor protein CyaY [Azohydromonas aeria]|uniref:iron donor protein CyaY n=1 Tax=Azohydromonas aeria TaxID=2590212 RepID=UPI0012F9A1A8|nr:iron donor protein CyaY [Azohydromonas aeria]